MPIVILGTSFNYVDVVFGAVLLIFALTGLFRGFISEVSSSLNWIISFLASFFLTPPIAKFIEPYFKIGIMLDIGLRIGLFFICFLTIFFTTSQFFKEIRDRVPKLLDKPLGFAFGCLKTIALFGVAYSMYSHLYDFITSGKNSEIAMIESAKKNNNSSTAPSAGYGQGQSFSESGVRINDNFQEVNGEEIKEIVAENLKANITTDKRNKFPESFLQSKCVNYIVFSGRTLDPVMKPIYISLIENYGESLKNKIFKEIEKSIMERVRKQEGEGSSKSGEQFEQGPAADAFDKMMRKLSSTNYEDYQNSTPDAEAQQQPSSPSSSDGRVEPLKPSQESQNNSQQGYDKNEIQKKERMMEIINRQQVR